MTKTDVTFDSAGITLAGHLYTPDGPADGPRPGIVVGHPGSGVKEQAAGLYARRLAGQGFVTLAFDAAYQGESGGEPRSLEDPAHRVEDLKAAVSYLTTRPEADADRIGVLGICASGGYVLPATGSDHRIKAVATVSAVDIARQFRLGADGTQDPAVFQGMLDAAANARTVAAHGEKPPVLTLFPETIEQARALGGEHGAEGFEYYRTPARSTPRSESFLDWTSIDRDGGIALLRQAAEAGVTLIDTADVYGPHTNELLIREALHPYPEHLVIATKGGFVRGGPAGARPALIDAIGNAAAYLRQCAYLSARRLGVERIDLYYLHSGRARDASFEDQVGTLAELRQLGLIRHIGLSNVTAAQLAATRQIVDIAAVSAHFNVVAREQAALLEAALEAGAAFVPWQPVSLTAPGSPTDTGGPAAVRRVLEPIASRHRATIAQITLAWLLARSPAIMPVPGITSIAHVRENLDAQDIELSRQDIHSIDSISPERTATQSPPSGSSVTAGTR